MFDVFIYHVLICKKNMAGAFSCQVAEELEKKRMGPRIAQAEVGRGGLRVRPLRLAETFGGSGHGIPGSLDTGGVESAVDLCLSRAPQNNLGL